MEFFTQKGFYLEVRSWENDYDHRATEIIRMDSLEDAKNWKRLLDRYGGTCHQRPWGLGNAWSKVEIDRVKESFESNEDMPFEEFTERYREFTGYGENGYRVVESVKLIEVRVAAQIVVHGG